MLNTSLFKSIIYYQQHDYSPSPIRHTIIRNIIPLNHLLNPASYPLRLFCIFMLVPLLAFLASCVSPEDRHIFKLRQQLVKDRTKCSIYERRDAATKLAAIGTPDAIEALIYGFKHPYASELSKELLVELGRSAIPFLVKSLKDKNKVVRFHSASSLGMIGDRSAIPFLVKSLKDKNKVVRFHSASSLGMIGDRSAVPALIEALNNSLDLNDKDIRSMDVRAVVAHALGKLGDPAAVEPLCKTLSEESLDPRYHIGVALAAGEALGQIGNSQAIPCLRNKLSNCSHHCYVYAKALVQVGDRRTAIDMLYSELEKGEERKRNAALALASLREKNMIPVLYELIMNDPPNSRGIDALGGFGIEAVPTLISLLESPPQTRARDQCGMIRSVIHELGQIGDIRAVPILIRKMHEMPYVRTYYYSSQPSRTRSEAIGFFYEALSALGAIGKDSVPALIESMKAYPSGRERVEIIETLGKIGDKRAIEVLIKEKMHYDQEVKDSAAKALLNINVQKNSNI